MTPRAWVLLAGMPSAWNRGAGLSFSSDNKTLFIQHAIPANTGYRVLLDATKIKGANGLFLDGEFKATGNSGNAVQGGNFDFTTTGSTSTAIFSTVAGNMNVNLLTSTALTYANFLKYANAGDWDNTFLHRSVQSGFKILQGGGFKLGTNNSIVLTPV